ncbi:hypothetical protein [Fibrisoma limi]|uniref:hypothetical protein n=1 Tax=Fibrisoma limi TaxID=663275 RepID=UPI0005869E80|nr:hypothetical protein [Fibrisoma limi]
MKTLGMLLILMTVGCWLVQAQSVQPTPKQPALSDSTKLSRPPVFSMGTAFYRKAGDPANVVRAELDNMPIKIPDSSQQYRMQNSYNRYGNPPQNRVEELLPKNLQIPSPKRK